MLIGINAKTPWFLATATVLGASACTTLGPMPTTTGVSPIPHQRPGADVQVGIVPGFHLSSATQAKPEGSGFGQIAAAFEPDRVLGVPGLIAGGRFISNTPDQLEPYLGWRGYVDAARTTAVAVVGFGTRSEGEHQGASFAATRLGGEVIADVNLSGHSDLAELHLLAGATVMGLWSTGSYCVDVDGNGRDCPDDGTAAPIDAQADVIVAAGRAGIALDLFRGRASVFHGGRVELSVLAGTMPRIVNGEKDGSATYASGGLTLTLGLGGE